MTTYPDGTRSGSIALPQRPFEGLAATLAAHDARVTELLRANNAEVERRRAAETRVRELEAALAIGLPWQPIATKPDAMRCGEIEVRGVESGIAVPFPVFRPTHWRFLPRDRHAVGKPATPVDRHRQALDACLAQDRADWDAAGRW